MAEPGLQVQGIPVPLPLQFKLKQDNKPHINRNNMLHLHSRDNK